MIATAPEMAPSALRTRINTALDWADRRPVVVFSALALLVLAIYLINLTTAPDFVVDEVLYSRVGQHIAQYDSISVLRGPFMVHPPLDFFANAAWEQMTGTADASSFDALMSLRYLSAIFCVFTSIITGLTARALLAGSGSRARTLGGIAATLLVAVNGFMLSFGRTALIEPAAIAAGAGIVYVAYRVRNMQLAQQLLILGVLIGLGCLVKQTVLFACLTPLVAGLLVRNRQRVVVGGGALLIGGVIWSALPLWTVINGGAGAFWKQQTVSIQRLLGLLHTSGVTLPSGSPISQFTRTFPLYASGYLALFAGAIAFVLIAIRARVFSRTVRPSYQAATVLAYGAMSYGFLVYSFAFGAANQQFVIYTAGASSLLIVWYFFGQHRNSAETVSAPADQSPGQTESADNELGGRTRKRVAGAVLGVMLLFGAFGWTRFYLVEPDDGTTSISNYVAENIAACIPINATGSGTRWSAALPDNPVSTYKYGQESLNAGVHLFLLSPKDARYRYGVMSPEFADWITANGRLVFETPSRSSELLQLWAVGPVLAVAPTPDCVTTAPAPLANAPASQFLAVLGGLLLLVGGIGAAVIVSSRRRTPDADRAHPPV